MVAAATGRGFAANAENATRGLSFASWLSGPRNSSLGKSMWYRARNLVGGLPWLKCRTSDWSRL